jgi:hypothetical protein
MLILECLQGCYVVKIWPGDIYLWPWKSIGFQILLRTKYVQSLVKIHWRMLILECSQGCYGRTDGSVIISLCNFAGEGIIEQQWTIEEIYIFCNSSHLEWRAGLSDTILKGTHPRTIPARFGLIWFRGFRGEDLNVKVYDVRQTDAKWWQKLTRPLARWAKKPCFKN